MCRMKIQIVPTEGGCCEDSVSESAFFLTRGFHSELPAGSSGGVSSGWGCWAAAEWVWGSVSPRVVLLSCFPHSPSLCVRCCSGPEWSESCKPPALSGACLSLELATERGWECVGSGSVAHRRLSPEAFCSSHFCPSHFWRSLALEACKSWARGSC